MIFSDYVENELTKTDMLDESIIKLGPDVRNKAFRSHHYETNKKDTRIQKLDKGKKSVEVKMSAEEIQNRRRAQKRAAQVRASREAQRTANWRKSNELRKTFGLDKKKKMTRIDWLMQKIRKIFGSKK